MLQNFLQLVTHPLLYLLEPCCLVTISKILGQWVFNLVTAGNAVVFGDLSVKMLSASVASSTRGVCMSGRNPSNVNNIEYVTFQV